MPEQLHDHIQFLKKKLLTADGDSAVTLRYEKNDIEKIIPHRDPFSFLHQLTHLNLETQTLEGISLIDQHSPIFKGHFPDKPVYPGVLQLEMMGQLALCLAYFINNNVTAIQQNCQPIRGLFTKVLFASFVHPILPGNEVKLCARVLEQDAFLGRVAAQAVVDNRLCSYTISEVYFDE